MTTAKYDTLYENLRKSFTVANEGSEYTLGEYMLMKANQKKEYAALPVAVRPTATKGERALAQVVSFVNDKLTIKTPPVKDKTIRAFPFRTSASAMLSAAVACSFMLCFTIAGAKLIEGGNGNVPTEQVSITDYAPEIVDGEIVEYNA